MSEARQLKIQTGVLKRLRKELSMYQKEQQQEQIKVEKLREEAADSYDIKYAENILAESAAMIPDTQQRLAEAVKELEGLLEGVGGVLAGSNELLAAQDELELAKPLVS